MNRLSTRRVAAGAAALALLTGGGVLAGCGGSDSSSNAATTAAAQAQPANGIEKLPAQEILDKSLAAANAATSVSIKGSITVEGQETSLDLQLGTNAAEGSFTAQGISIKIIATGSKSYLKLTGGDFAKLAGQDDSPEVAKAVSALIGDKWLLVPEDSGVDELVGLGQFAKKDSLVKGILEPSGDVTVKGTGEVDGIPVVFIESSDGGGTLAIQTVGEPLPVQITGSDGSGSGEVNFTGWNAPVTVTAPTDVVDISALADLGGSSN